MNRRRHPGLERIGTVQCDETTRRAVLKRTCWLMCALAALLIYARSRRPLPRRLHRGCTGRQRRAGATMTPVQRADSAPKGTLKNPYKDTDAAAVKAGQQLYMNYGCNGCHGGGGRRGHVPAADQRRLGLRRRRRHAVPAGGLRQPDPAEQGLQPQGARRTSSGRCRRWGRW